MKRTASRRFRTPSRLWSILPCGPRSYAICQPGPLVPPSHISSICRGWSGNCIAIRRLCSTFLPSNLEGSRGAKIEARRYRAALIFKVLSRGGPFWAPVFGPLVLSENVFLIFEVSSFPALGPHYQSETKWTIDLYFQHSARRNRATESCDGFRLTPCKGHVWARLGTSGHVPRIAHNWNLRFAE